MCEKIFLVNIFICVRQEYGSSYWQFMLTIKLVKLKLTFDISLMYLFIDSLYLCLYW